MRRTPSHIVEKLYLWVRLVEGKGLMFSRTIPGFHDEPLKGVRAGQRSIRLSRAYRAIYTVTPSAEIEVVTVEEVNKHDY